MHQAAFNSSVSETLQKQPLVYFQLSEPISFANLSSATLAQLSEFGVFSAQRYLAKLYLVQNKKRDAELFLAQFMPAWTAHDQKKFVQWLFDNELTNYLDALPDIATQTGLVKQVLSLQKGHEIRELPDFLVDRFSLSLPRYQQSNCIFNVVVLGEDLSSLNHAESLLKSFGENPEPFDGAYCFSKPTFLNAKAACGLDTQGFATCEFEPDVMRHLNKFDFAIVITKQGLANVKQKVMTLNKNSNYNVLIHELMHFQGFEDEYPFSKEKAIHRCSTPGLIAPNLFVGNAKDAPQGWHKSQSCRDGIYNSYRPSEKWTKLEYQAIELSDEYRQLWINAIIHTGSVSPLLSSK
ncbi:hypothetical protein PALB_34620 [Pseudoalteromonas luteoviolacea B = ATCC 29581]|nr:hypothetical protein PALB_34620 [Pseudoalteromonas luteoviolacea B = ATCC 29581]